jgi:hypothetical protein
MAQVVENLCSKCKALSSKPIPSKKYKQKMDLTHMNKILLYSCQNAYHEDQKQQQILARMWGEKEPSYTAGGNVN